MLIDILHLHYLSTNFNSIVTGGYLHKPLFKIFHTLRSHTFEVLQTSTITLIRYFAMKQK